MGSSGGSGGSGGSSGGGRFRTLPEVLDGTLKKHPQLSQVVLYEHPMYLVANKFTRGAPNHFVGAPIEFLTQLHKDQVISSDIPCGRNTHYFDADPRAGEAGPAGAAHRRVKETEQPFEAIIRPEYWESWHAPRGAMPSTPLTTLVDTPFMRKFAAEMAAFQRDIGASSGTKHTGFEIVTPSVSLRIVSQYPKPTTCL